MLALQFLFQFWCKSVSASKYYSGSFRLICAVEAGLIMALPKAS